MVRITDPERSRAFYEALGFTYSRALAISAAVFEFTWMKFRPIDRLP
jgi:hypothetical protein